jgi:hypothetical protein
MSGSMCVTGIVRMPSHGLGCVCRSCRPSGRVAGGKQRTDGCVRVTGIVRSPFAGLHVFAVPLGHVHDGAMVVRDDTRKTLESHAMPDSPSHHRPPPLHYSSLPATASSSWRMDGRRSASKSSASRTRRASLAGAPGSTTALASYGRTASSREGG